MKVKNKRKGGKEGGILLMEIKKERGRRELITRELGKEGNEVDNNE
jgi:hypothetical protein